MKSPQEQELRAQAKQVRGRLEILSTDLGAAEREVEKLAPQREQHELLAQACGSLEKLAELGAASLFWGDAIEPARIAERLHDARARVDAFHAQLSELETRRQAVQAKIGREEENLEILGEDLYQIREDEERRKLEWIVEREISPLPPRTQRMAWSRGGEEDRRFHKSLVGSLAASLLLGALLPMIDLPAPKRFVPEDIPKRLAQLVRPELPKPVPAPPAAEETPPEREPEPIDEPEPTEPPPEQPSEQVAAAKPDPSKQPGPGLESGKPGTPRKQVGKAGILAFKDKFASLAKDKREPRLGSDARYGNADEASKASMPQRSMLTSNAPGSSGGINLASLSRNVGSGDGGGGGAGAMHGVQVGSPSSNITSIGGNGNGGRPRAGGGGGQAASRTDEEIQIVFDRHKAAFYRLYNRELRNDPTLRGQMVLRLTIEPDGSVSMCVLQSSDMKAPDLAAQVVGRVQAINFGAKDVEALTIVYPIDFLPKA